VLSGPEGKYVGSFNNGNTLTYNSLDFGSGVNQVQMRVASPAGEGELQIIVNGQTAGQCFIPNTGSWDKYQTVTCGVDPVIAKGVKSLVIKAVASTNYDLVNLNWFKFASVSNNALAQYEAEKYSSHSGVVVMAGSEGNYAGAMATGDWLTYSSLNFGSGATSVQLRVASAKSGGSVEVRLDSASGPVIGKCTIPNTGSWNSWTTVTCKVDASQAKGVRTLSLKFVASFPQEFANLNWFKFLP
jgi:hypothetical protein